MIVKRIFWLLTGTIVVLASLYGFLWWLMATSSVTTHGDMSFGKGNIEVPTERSPLTYRESNLNEALLDKWAAKPFLDWQEEGKVNVPRILAAKLQRQRQVQEVNEYLLRAKVRGTVGSTGPFHSTGDYDFTLAGLCLLLYSFGDSEHLLYPETVAHILHVLMTESGGKPLVWTPRVLGLPLRDTENHILMTEGSRYLKNRWLALHGDQDPAFDNKQNGLEDFLLEHLRHMEVAGFHEYNSRPYIGYTLTALLNLQSFADQPVRDAATRILDRANWEYALGSLNYRRSPPFRRQARRAADTDLDGDYHTAMIKAWMSSIDQDVGALRSGEHHAIWVPFTNYQLPDKVVQWIIRKPEEYFVRLGHGLDGSPEIYSGGPRFLISAGGVAKDRFSQAVARPTTLMLLDGATELSELLHIKGKSPDYRDWNNTGVARRFAIGEQLVIPDSWQAIEAIGAWQLFEQTGVRIVTYERGDMALFYLLNPETQQFSDLVTLNSDPEHLNNEFKLSSKQQIRYELDAPLNRWVIHHPTVDRNFDTWPLLSGDLAVSH